MSREDVWARISLLRGDITTQQVDAIVNAANIALAGGGGVDGAIHRAAGIKLHLACAKLLGCRTGSAKITPGFNLPAKYVIHAVGPRYRDGRHGEPEALASCHRVALQLAAERDCETVAFPAISCGVYGYPVAAAAGIATSTVADVLAEHELPRAVRWVLFDDPTFNIFSAAMDNLKRL